ncbi:MAG: hypothetical protein HY701_13550 [Gemmatimonadetes bacterium]|nr:hypothetical protein [Gemmatimonadota bacterium]
MRRELTVAIFGLAAITLPAMAQRPDIEHPPGQHYSSNMHVTFHVPLVAESDIRIEQDLSRPYVFQPHGRPAGYHILDIKDPAKAHVIYSWEIEEPDLHQGGASGIMLFKHKGRYYAVESYQFRQGGPDNDLVAIVFDVTGLPDTSKVKEVARIRDKVNPGGSHEAFTYKHSDGRPIFFTTVANNALQANMYDLGKLLDGDPSQGLIGAVPKPSDMPVNRFGGYHDMYVAYDPATHQDKFYGPGFTGYVIYDVTRPEEPKLLASFTGVSGVDVAHTFMADPTGRYVIGESEAQYQPIRIFDAKPALDGTVRNVSRPIGAWSPSWRNLVHQFEIRWPYVFAAAYADGLHVFNMMDPTNPYTVAFYDVYDKPTLDMGNPAGRDANSVMTGTFGVDIRNADGLIVISDMRTGTWGFRMDGFSGWNGHQWGVPNISSVQDWDNGPEGAPKTAKVS